MSWKRTIYHTWLCLKDFLLPTEHGIQRRHDIRTGKRKRWD